LKTDTIFRVVRYCC